MPWPLGTAALQSRIKAMLGVRGNIPLELDEQIVPVVNVLDFDRGPVTYPIYGTAARTDGAVVGSFSHVGVRAGVGTLLVVDRVFVHNRTGAVMDFFIGYDSDPAADAEDNVIAVNLPPAGTTNRFLAAAGFDRTQVAQMVSATDFRVRLLGDTTLACEGPPWVLYAPTAALARALVVTPSSNNTEVGASFVVREYEVL